MTDQILNAYTSPADKIIGLYFGAKHCKWCKAFTPQLRSVYNHLRLYGIEILFVSTDKTKEAFESHRFDHPWPAISYDDHDHAGLRERYHVMTVPTLVFVDKKGTIIEGDGRNVMAGCVEQSYDSFAAARVIAERLDAISYEYDSDDSDF